MARRDGQAGTGKGAGGRCPVCGAPRSRRYRPFCSARCADRDLGRWLKGVYRIPTEELPDGGEAERDDDR